MILHIYDQDFNRRGIITNYTSVEWTEDYYGMGQFALYCYDTDYNLSLLKENWYVAQKGKMTAMVIRKVRCEAAEGVVEVRGFTTNDLINQRIIADTINVRNVEQGMYDMVNSCLEGHRNLRNVETSKPQGLTDVFETQFTLKFLHDCLITLGEASDVGFYTAFDPQNKRHVFTVYKGLDRRSGQRENRPAIFSTELRNLANVIIIKDSLIFRNVAYVAGGGEGAERKVVIVNDQEFEGLDRFELPVDARDLQKTYHDNGGNEKEYTDEEYERLLTARGIEKLNEHLRTETFVAEIDAKGFGADFYLGDLVSCKSEKYGLRIDTRILSYSEISENNQTRLSLTMGNPEIIALEVVKTWL